MRKRAAATTILILLLLWVSPAYAGDPGKLTVDGNRTKEYIRVLASAEMEGRKSCTEGFRRAAEWVASKYEEWGLKPAGENGTYFQNVTFSRGFDWNTGIPKLSVREREFLFDDGDYSLLSSSVITPCSTAAASSVRTPTSYSAASSAAASIP